MLAALTGLSASPAAASSSSGVDFITCNPLADDGNVVFDGLAGLVEGGTARGLESGGGGEPALNELHTDLPTSAKGKAGGNFKVTVPIHFHVVHDGSIGKVTLAQINDQITVLNLTYGGFEGGYRTGFSFKLASVDYTDNASWF